MKFKVLNKEEFNDFLNNNELNNFLQSPLMDEVSKKKHQQVFYVGMEEKNKIICGARLLCINSKFGKKIFYSPRGLIINYNNKALLEKFTYHLKKFIKENNGFELIIDPNILYKQRDIDGKIVEYGFNNENIIKDLKNLGYRHLGFSRGVDTSRQVRWTFTINIKDKTEDEIFSNFNQNTKRLINKAIKNDISIREIEYDELTNFKSITQNSSDRVGFKDKSLDYYQTIYKEFVPKNKAKFIIASLDLKKYLNNLEKEKKELTLKIEKLNDKNKIKNIENQIKVISDKINEAKKIIKEDNSIIDLSAAMFITYGKEVIYAFGGNVDKYMSFNGSHLLQWKMIKYAIKNNFEKYDFYGISGIFNESDSNYGVYKFKRGFGGVVEEYIGEFSLPITPYYYINSILSKLKKFLKKRK